MRRSLVFLLFAAASSVAIGCEHDKPVPLAPAAQAGGAGAAAWERLKRALPGSWQMEDNNDPFVVSYRLVSNESALVESWGAGGAHETMTVFHPDHAELLLTHYCAQGNQPRLRLVDATGDRVTFRFLDATNVLPGQAVLTERTLRLGAEAIEDTEVYRQPQGGEERTVYRLRRVGK